MLSAPVDDRLAKYPFRVPACGELLLERTTGETGDTAPADVVSSPSPSVPVPASASSASPAFTGALEVRPASFPRLAMAPVQRNSLPYPRHSLPEAAHLLQCGYERSQRSRCRRQLWHGFVGGWTEPMMTVTLQTPC